MGTIRAFGFFGRLFVSRRGRVIRVLSSEGVLFARRSNSVMCKYSEDSERKNVRHRPKSFGHS
jgi:uncharacterized Fe-S cluster-containing MiaB family protein